MSAASYIAAIVAGIGVATFLFTLSSYFLNMGGTIVDQAFRVVLTRRGAYWVVMNLSDVPITRVEIYANGIPVPEMKTFLRVGEEFRFRPEQSTAAESVEVHFWGPRGVGWRLSGTGAIEMTQSGKVRGRVIRWVAWPWYHRDVKRWYHRVAKRFPVLRNRR